jgi:anti-sigma B factor antagonist
MTANLYTVPMSAILKTRFAGEIAVVDISGRITMGEASFALRDTVRELIAGGHMKILLNLAGVAFMDSAGIGELVSGYVSATNKQGTLKLCELTKRIRDLFQVVRLYNVLPIFESEEDALRTFV